MKLLYTNFHAGDGGGHTTYIRELAAALASRHEVHVAAPPGSRLNREARALPGVFVLDQPFPNGLNRWKARRRARAQLADYLHRQAFDIVHVNGSADHRLVLSAMPPKRPALVWTKHNSKPVRGIGNALRARRTDLVIAVCECTRRELLRTAYRRCRIETVYNGVDVERWSPWPADAAKAERARWNGGDDHLFLLGSNAGTASYKGWMDLMEALPRLSADVRSRLRVLVAGVPPKADELERVAQLGLAGQVVFPGVLTDARGMVAALDAGFVLSYDVETISFACREMMAMGKPVLLTDYAGLPENIREGTDGWLVPVRDPDAIAAAVTRLVEQRDALPAMGAVAREHAEREFGLPLFVGRTEAAYERLLGLR
ncbi:Glycosyltransferase involved in cell wall bisynthesis [Dyella jiangningensis]|uniref:glycosyltransferase family 4 protein n=1 Tax=Dyella sp. AtDHG13 TaxID=1938897 RepID=UPI00089190CC|nr:glycosyltransferase family 4 protein [Dyella sp. AtDHG13]PXV57020.1 glycosyltransferase involved in cell wall biosynthesis [Dyella sp. AtDHG13]SDK64357.1 Glycosyltransferase involved in cell wall bisynthesis [Dyella jiangningensis]